MGEGGDRRWAPFPVQDWSTLPDTGRPPGADRPGPLRCPGRRTRPAPARPASPPGGCPWSCCSASAWSSAPGRGWPAGPQPQTAALRFVPADGDAAWQRVDLDPGDA